MSAVRPFGHLDTATILVIGQDPRLQRSQAEAEVAFFFDYLSRSQPTYGPEASKYNLARKVCSYVNELVGREVSLRELYVTNLCNEFLDHALGSGTVLIPDIQARRGVEQITQIVADGHFKVILPMAVQTSYHLCRLNFIAEDSELIIRFTHAARPRASKIEQGIYVQSGKAPFLTVCGCKFHHHSVPVVPIVHVKQWPLNAQMVRYTEPMQRASQNIQTAIQASPRAGQG